MKNKFSSDYCLSCSKEMRKWITDTERNKKGNAIPNTGKCVSMCVEDGCPEQGKVYQSIQNIDNIKIKIYGPVLKGKTKLFRKVYGFIDGQNYKFIDDIEKGKECKK